MNRTLIRRSICLLFAFAGPVSHLAAQQQPQREHVRCEGKIKAMARGLLHVVGEDGQQWLVAVEAKPQDISFQASTTPAFLRTGMLVQFRSVLDKKAEAQSPITEIRVIAPREGIKLGLTPEGGFGGGELFASEDDAAGKKKKKNSDDKQFQVAGTIRSIKDRKIQVTAGGFTVKGELAENCGVSLDIADYSFAREGDPISLQGWHHVGKPNQIYATNLVITAEKPLSPSEDLKKRRLPAKSADKDGADADAKKDSDSADSPPGKSAKKSRLTDPKKPVERK